ncbi:MAG: hypothetical protein ABI026_05770, partial [Gemmatimonadaceae bacterium]
RCARHREVSLFAAVAVEYRAVVSGRATLKSAFRHPRENRKIPPFPRKREDSVIPAKAGTHLLPTISDYSAVAEIDNMGPRFRGDDEGGAGMTRAVRG